MQYVNTIRLILSLLPLVLEVIRAVEAAFPQGGNGAAKLALVREAIEGGYNLANDTVVAFDTVWPAINRIVDASVAAYNASGVFRK